MHVLLLLCIVSLTSAQICRNMTNCYDCAMSSCIWCSTYARCVEKPTGCPQSTDFVHFPSDCRCLESEAQSCETCTTINSRCRWCPSRATCGMNARCDNFYNVQECPKRSPLGSPILLVVFIPIVFLLTSLFAILARSRYQRAGQAAAIAIAPNPLIVNQNPNQDDSSSSSSDSDSSSSESSDSETSEEDKSPSGSKVVE
eukprot:TRINITY_DN2261_c0_g1_i1.p1 TRINITY_DN2261_c0_g1~~TRINITY_DN2261_c0_g1_i1.p1  ORF type:complete len:212 (-),score=16.88 TRINITY_DN2261_c0_g1_i1:15-614(-)